MRARAAREPGQQPTALGGAQIERKRTLRQVQARLEGGPGGMLVDAVQIERDLRRAAGRAGPHAAGKRLNTASWPSTAWPTSSWSMLT